MIELTVQVDGEKELVARLDGMTEQIRIRLRAALDEDLGPALRDAAEARAPRHSGRRSPASRKFGPLSSAMRAKLKEKGDSLYEVVDMGRAFYGGFQERGLNTMRKPARKRGIAGTRIRHLKSGGVSVSARRGLMPLASGYREKPFHLPKHPFLRPAFDSMRARITASLSKAVADGLKA